jgi:hypothetical protein
MKVAQLSNLAKKYGPFEASQYLIFTSILSIGGFASAIAMSQYFTPLHTNSYNVLLHWLCIQSMALGAGGLFGLKYLNFSMLPEVTR